MDLWLFRDMGTDFMGVVVEGRRGPMMVRGCSCWAGQDSTTWDLAVDSWGEQLVVS